MKFLPNQSKWRQWSAAYVFLFPTLVLMGIFNFYPMFSSFFLSTWDYFPNSPNNQFVGLGNFIRLWNDSAFWDALVNSVLYLLVVPMIIACSLGLAMLVEPHIPFINFFRACYYIPVVTMMVVVAWTWKMIFNTDSGLLNQILGNMGLISEDQPIPWLTNENMALWTIMTITMWKGLGYYMVIFIVGLKAIPKELVEAARIDGANRWQNFCNVTFPNLWPTVSLVSILSSIAALQVFEEIYVMTRGKFDTSTLVYEIYETGFDMQAGGGLEMGYACAMGVVLFAMVFTFTAFAVRFMEGVYTTD